MSLYSIDVQRSYASFDDYWSIVLGGPSTAALLAAMLPEPRTQLQARLRAKLGVDGGGPFLCTARAHAVRGRVPR